MKRVAAPAVIGGTTLVAFATAAWHAQGDPTPTTSVVRATDEPDVEAHLPPAISGALDRWRSRLHDAACLKVIGDTDQTWHNLYEFDDENHPRLVVSEHFQVHCWMTRDLCWTSIYAKHDGVVDTSHAVFQQLWTKATGVVRERQWIADSEAYSARRYESQGPHGPEHGHFDSRGCLWGGFTESWLSMAHDPNAARKVTLGAYRSPNISIVPPTVVDGGVWLDVFRSHVERDRYPDDETKLYRRSDHMLLTHEDTGEPVVSEWRTIVTTDRYENGRRPQLIYATRRNQYTFLDAPPDRLAEVTAAFIAQIDEAID
ncbi:MAG: hypothetical protein AAGI53_15430 [Planctomycetota bacterium]